MRWTLLFLVSVCVFQLSAQHAYVVYGSIDGQADEQFFGCGEKFKVKMADGIKMKGRIDTVFADGMILSGDTVLFSEVKKIGYKEHSKFLRQYTLIAGTGVGLGALFIGISALMSASPENHAVGAEMFTGIGAVLVLFTGPFFVDAVHRSTGWHVLRITKYDHLYGLMGNHDAKG